MLFPAVPREQTAAVSDPRFVKVTVPGVPTVTVEPLTVDAVPPVVVTLRDMYGFADKYPVSTRFPYTFKSIVFVVVPFIVTLFLNNAVCSKSVFPLSYIFTAVVPSLFNNSIPAVVFDLIL